MEDENNPPDKPSNPCPQNGATGVALNVNLSWIGGDPDTGDTVYYTLYFDTTVSPSLVFSNRCTLSYDTGALLYNTTYYWKVVARDQHGESTSGSMWMFTTDTSDNQPPCIPGNPSPSDSAVQQGVDLLLSWEGGDPDTGDVAVYDIYFDTLTTPSLLTSGHSSTSYNPGVLEFAKRYYWKIVARDVEGDTSVGPVWTFTTKDTLVVKNIVSAPASEPTGLTWDGSYLWVSDSIKYKIYCIDTSASVVKSFTAPDSAPTGLTWDGTNLWVSDCGTKFIYKIDADSGAVIDSFASPDTCPMGLAWKSSTSLWHCGSASARIYELNPADGNELRSFASPGSEPRGLTWTGEYLWVCDTDRIYKVSTVSGLAEQDFPAPGNAPTGLTWDGKYLWCTDTETELIYKLEHLVAQ